MSKKSKILADKKVSNKHTTTTDLTEKFISFIKNIPEISKISIGIIKHTGSKNRKIKYIQIKGAIKVSITGNGAVQVVYLYSENIQNLIPIIDSFSNELK